MLYRTVFLSDTDLMTTAEPVTIFDSLVGEITQHYHRGRVLVAIDGADGQATHGFAESLAAAMRSRSWHVLRLGMTPGAASDIPVATLPHPDKYRADEDYSHLRAIVAKFRESKLAVDPSVPEVPADAMLIVDGRFLLRPELRGIWHFGVWLEGDMHLSDESLEAQIQYTRDSAPRAAADAIFDVTNAAAPARVWADTC